MKPVFAQAREAFHAAISGELLFTDSEGIPSNADKSNRASIAIAAKIAALIGSSIQDQRLAGQSSGNRFEDAALRFLEATFLRLDHLRPGDWTVERCGRQLEIARFDQYKHLAKLHELTGQYPELAAALGTGYTIIPDIVVVRGLADDAVINAPVPLVSQDVATRASLRQREFGMPLLHASVSCKWTIRSDRAQNARSEALVLLRDRKGRAPHIAVVTGEPLPSRLASLALGTGDIDCVYHFALPELIESLAALDFEDHSEILETMISGNRLKDISDLPLDLAV